MAILNRQHTLEELEQGCKYIHAITDEFGIKKVPENLTHIFSVLCCELAKRDIEIELLKNALLKQCDVFDSVNDKLALHQTIEKTIDLREELSKLRLLKYGENGYSVATALSER